MAEGGVIVETRANGAGYYKIMADRHECGRCGRAILIGMPPVPLAEHYESDYAAIAAGITVDFAT